ncbi:MAG: peptidyl-prolyl cis-trans isomerase [Flavobacteriaceae bacterium]
MIKSWFTGLFLLLLVASCQWFSSPQKPELVARYGAEELYLSDIPSSLYTGKSPEDSIVAIHYYIDKWALELMYVEKAGVNLSEEKLTELSELVANYRADLLALAYKEVMAQSALDSVVSSEEMAAFYQSEQVNFQLKEKIVQLRYVQAPVDYPALNQVRKSLKRFNKADQKYLDSTSIYLDQVFINDSQWIPARELFVAIKPIMPENEHLYLKNAQFFEIQDSLGVYLGQVKTVLTPPEVAPLSYVAKDIKTILINRRKQNYFRNLEKALLDEAIRKKELEIYRP